MLSPNHLELLAELNSDPEVRRYFPGGAHDRDQTRKRLLELIECHEKYGFPGFCIFKKGTNEFIGRCGLSRLGNGEVETGYLIARDYWGHGYATEALKAVLNWARENTGLEYIIGFAPTDHKASHRVMEKSGLACYKIDLAHGVDCDFYKYVISRVSCCYS